MNSIIVAVLFVCVEGTCAFLTPKPAYYHSVVECERALVKAFVELKSEQPKIVGSASCIKVELDTI